MAQSPAGLLVLLVSTTTVLKAASSTRWTDAGRAAQRTYWDLPRPAAGVCPSISDCPDSRLTFDEGRLGYEAASPEDRVNGRSEDGFKGNEKLREGRERTWELLLNLSSWLPAETSISKLSGTGW